MDIYCELCGCRCNGNHVYCEDCQRMVCTGCYDGLTDQCSECSTGSSIKLPSIEEIAKAIEDPPEKWEGRCHEVACAILLAGLVKGSSCYGLYYGPISENCAMFSSKSIAVRHGWIELEDDTVFDPTRWVFEAVSPYLYHGIYASKEYDLGGAELRKALRQPYPGFNTTEKTFELPEELTGSLNRTSGEKIVSKISLGQLFWLANLGPHELGPTAYHLYSWLDEQDCKPFVPIDFWNSVMEKNNVACTNSRRA